MGGLKLIFRVFLAFMLIVLLAGRSNAQTYKNTVGINLWSYAGINYERFIKDDKSISMAINRHDWNYFPFKDDVTLVKAQVEYRMYEQLDFGFFWALGINYRLRDDASFPRESDFVNFFNPYGNDEVTYDFRLHSWGAAGVGGYRTKTFFGRFTGEATFRMGYFFANHYEYINDNGSVSTSERQDVTERLSPDIAFSARIGYSF